MPVKWDQLLPSIGGVIPLIGVIIALATFIYGFRQVTEKLRIQNTIAKHRIEEEYLRRALFVIFNCYNAALVYLGLWNAYKKDLGIALRKNAPDAMRMQLDADFLKDWRSFDREVSAIKEVIRATARDDDLLQELDDAYAASAALFDELMDHADVFKTEKELTDSTVAKNAKKAAGQAAEALARRLNGLYAG